MNPVEEIKQRIDIVDLIGESVSLQKSGRNYRALCPFHAEKAASFYVFPDKGTWHCFGGCATGGDVFAFVMKKENVDFSGALRILAERAGISLGRKTGAAEETEKDRLRQANEVAVLFFHNALLNTQAATIALNYLTMRGIDRQTVDTFQLGYAPDAWDALREHLKGRGFSQAELLRAGLLVEGDRDAYDRFRHRVIIPIRDERGRTVGFGSRMLPSGDAGEAATEAEGPKYLNTPQTPIFDKGAILFGLDRAAEHIRRSDLAVIVEGYMDVIAAHQHDNANVVASMGTALTERQITLLRRLTENIVLAFDPDSAGQAASERGDLVAQRLGAQIRIMRLPKGQDPDEIIRADPEAWRRFIVEAEAPKAFSAAAFQSTPTEHGRRVGGSRRKTTPVAPEEKVDISKGEETCLALLVRYPNLRNQGLALNEELFDDALNRQVLEAWRGTEPELDLLEVVSDEALRQRVESIISRNMPPYAPVEAERAFESCTERLKKSKIKDEKRARNSEIAEKERALGSERLVEHARMAMQGEALPQDLPEDETAGVAALVRDTEAGLELHEKHDPAKGGNNPSKEQQRI